MLFSHSLRALPPGTWTRPSGSGRRHRACGALAPGGELGGDGVGGLVGGGNGGGTLVVGVICLLDMDGTQSITTCFRLFFCVLSS